MLMISAKQVQKNREGIKEMWKRIPKKWIDLGTFLEAKGLEHENEVALKCGGKGGPHNECEAVACFCGWNWTYYPYQQWCKRHMLDIASPTNLSIFLGLEVNNHRLFATRQNYGISVKQEVRQRIAVLMRHDIVDHEQDCIRIDETYMVPV